MARAGAAAALVLSFGLRALAQEPAREFADSVEREFAIRRWAQAASEVEPPRADASLDMRVSWLRALERAREFPSPGEEVGPLETLSALGAQPAPDLSCAALRLGLVEDADELLAAARHALPAVRLAALQSPASGLEAAEALVELARDVDERVAESALDRLALLSSSTPAAGELRARVLAGAGVGAWTGLARRFERLDPGREWLAALEAQAQEPGQLAIVAALRVRWSRGACSPSDAERIALAWPGPERFEELFTAAARVARAPRSVLGLALLERLRLAGDGASALPLLRGSLEALPPAEVLHWLHAQPVLAERIGEDALDATSVHAAELRPVDLEPWLGGERSAAIRRAAVALARTLLVDERRGEFGESLVAALGDSDRATSDEAFVALCDARPVEPWLDALYRRWRTVEPRRAEALLAELPRGVRLEPFQAELCSIASGGGAAGAAAFELLAPLAPDAGIAGIARERLGEELAALDRIGLRATELRAAALLRALHEQAGAAAHDELERVLRRALDRVEVSKVAIWALGQDAVGRERLGKWLGADVPRRLRVEAALARAPHGDARAVAVLRSDWSGCDFELRARALRALDAGGSAEALAWIRRVALDGSENELHRELALDLLSARRPADVDTLLAVAVDRDLDLRRHALLSLGACGDERAIGWLRARRTASVGDIETPEVRTVRELEREAIWMALSAAQAVDEALVAEWLSAPLRAAREQVRARFLGRAQGGTEFSWRAELAVAEELARAGRLAPALDASGPWWTCDARLLAALGERASSRGDLASARRLLAAAGVGLLGEAEGEERDLRLFEVRCALLGACEAAGAVEEHAALVRRLVGDERLGRGPHRAFERVFGAFDPARGIDGLARLESSAPLLRARSLLAQGQREAARAALSEATALAGYSRAALEDCAKVEDLLRR